MANFTINIPPLAIALAGGVLPSLIWLWFWLKQDKDVSAPEPAGFVALSFAAGMVIVYAVLPVEQFILSSMPTIVSISGFITTKLGTVPFTDETIQVTLWALTEEIAKYATVFFIAFHARKLAEPVDTVIYLVTAALGFAAMENALYILKGLPDAGSLQIIIDSNLRFVGATIVHTVCSGIVGVTLAFAFYSSKFTKAIAATIGLIIGTLLHTYFNLTIINIHGTIGVLAVFIPFWIAVVCILILMRVLEQINDRRQISKTL